MSLLWANSWTFNLLVLTSHVHECRLLFISYGRLLETCGKQKWTFCFSMAMLEIQTNGRVRGRSTSTLMCVGQRSGYLLTLTLTSGCCSCHIMVNHVPLMSSMSSSKLLSSGIHLSWHREFRSGVLSDWIPVRLLDDWKPTGGSSTSSHNDEVDYKLYF
jgi:hypothetical protein